MELKKVNLFIDDIAYQASPGEMIIQVADRNSIQIPRFCYHKNLSVAANCRMCLVEVEKSPKPLVACATPVVEGMKVFTRSSVAKQAQRGTMEFLLINHPLDCPICDQGGECELQDLAMGFGTGVSSYVEHKRVVKDENLGVLISTDMTRCIHCTRCVRFGQEIAGLRELGLTGRGENMRIETFVNSVMDSELSGNIIDLCPVGALTSKPFRMNARSWEMIQHPSIAQHDSFGSNVFHHTLRNQIKRVVPRENQSVNDTWISDRDRFSYLAYSSNDRLLTPQIKSNGKWHNVEWQEAIKTCLENWTELESGKSKSKMSVLIGAMSTCEDSYAAVKFFSSLGFTNIDYRIRNHTLSKSDNLPAQLTIPSLESLQQSKLILLYGINPRKDIPIFSLALQNCVKQNRSKIHIWNTLHYQQTFTTNQLIAHDLVLARCALYLLSNVELLSQSKQNITLDFKDISPYKVEIEALAKELLAHGQNADIIISTTSSHHKYFSEICSIFNQISALTKARFSVMPSQANENGLRLALRTRGIKQHDDEFNHSSHFWIQNLEPHRDAFRSDLYRQAFKSAKSVIACTTFADDTLREYATVLLPLAPIGEQGGTLINCFGQWQTFNSSVAPTSEVKSGWLISKLLANEARIPGFNWLSEHDVLSEYSSLNSTTTSASTDSSNLNILKEHKIDNIFIPEKNYLVTVWGMYQSDSMCRRSKPLQETTDGVRDSKVLVSISLANKLGIISGSNVEIAMGNIKIIAVAEASNIVPSNCVSISLGSTIASEIVQGENQEVELRLVS
ncbi:MAG: NADH-quinone oxidoreductase subunit NuoG [Methylacidiphilales bacterium]|nr:NADH-quinone oxidoreductase subunit NuoG [Candidatus Methylacidiphilales bacterium]